MLGPDQAKFQQGPAVPENGGLLLGLHLSQPQN